MSTTQLTESNAEEVFRLFNVMQQHGARCCVELTAAKAAEPIMGIVQVPVKAEYSKNDYADLLIVNMGENTEFAFRVGEFSFNKHVSVNQIDIAILSDENIAWFSSAELTPEAIAEASNYVVRVEPRETGPEPISPQEQALIYHLRGLGREDLTDAIDGILIEAKRNQQRMDAEADRKLANVYRERMEQLKTLAELIGSVNEEYLV